jgi:hypothetical protein
MMKTSLILGSFAVGFAPLLASAATLTSVPIIGGMVMPMISYHSDDGMMHGMMPSEIPQLTPLLVSRPGDNFDPNDPWFDALDPTRQGLAFNRRYGFMMDASSDPLPTGTQMWIRKLSSSADLKFYNASASDPKAFTPIFGTDGSTNALYWDGVMFHPVVTAPPGTNSFTATFEVLLVNSTTGEEVPNSASAPMVLNWTDVPDGRPVLSLAQKIMVAWPSGTTTNWVLESASYADASTWTTVTNTPVTVDGQPCVILDESAAQHFFRMRYVP